MHLETYLAKRVKARRGDMTFRQAEADSGVCYSTLRRIEQGELPNVRTLAKIIYWAKINASALFAHSPKTVEEASP